MSPVRRRTSGFTAIEILLVLAVIGILLSIGYVGVQRLNARYRLNDAQQAVTQAFNSARSDTRRLSVDRSVSWSGSSTQLKIVNVSNSSVVKTIDLQYGVTMSAGSVSLSSVTYRAPYSRSDGTNFDITLTEPRYGLTTKVRVSGVTGKVIRVVQ